MSNPSSTIKIETGDGPMSAHLAMPAGSGRPALVLIQEIFGVNQVMRDLAAFFASNGYVTVVPDLFWRLEPGVQLTDGTQEDWGKAFGLMRRFDTDKGIADIAATIRTARHLPGTTGKVGAIGYCLGGKLAYMTAARTDCDACVGYYGIGIQDLLGEKKNIRKPLMLHIPTADQFNPLEAQRQIHAALDDQPRVTLHDYAGNDHAFARVGGQHYDKAAAELANSRTLAFLAQSLA